MAGNYNSRFLEVLNTSFLACDEDGKGFVETNRLIDFLISQEPSWMDTESIIREELNKMLHGDLNDTISKEDFIKSLQVWFEASLSQHKDVDKGECVKSEIEKYSSSTSGFGEPSEIASGSSNNSMEEIYTGTPFGSSFITHTVTGELTFTNEDSPDETSLNDSGSSQADRLVRVLQSEVSTLLHKKVDLENLNKSLCEQISCLEDTLAKKKDESEDYKKQLCKVSNRLELQIQKYEETEDRINLVMEENKLVIIQLSQSERENTKLKLMICDLEEKLERSLRENKEKTTELEEISNKLNKLKKLHNETKQLLAQERENFKFKEVERESAWSEVMEENRNLQSQLISNTSYTEDIKSQLRATLKELSDFQSTRIKGILQTDDSCNHPNSDNSMIRIDENFSLGNTIPFESSLLAELKDEVEADRRECCCVCKQNISLYPMSTNKVDVAVGTSTIETMDKETVTAFPKITEVTQVLEDRKSSMFCILKSRRSVKKWAFLLGAVIFLSLLLVFLTFHVVLSSSVRRSHKPVFYFIPFFHIEVEASKISLPIN